MSPATASTLIKSADPALNEEDRVFLWRSEELRRAGYGSEAATLLAASPDIDFDRAIELRARRLRAA